MTDLDAFSAWMGSATRAALLVARERVYQARRQAPEERPATNALLKRITQELAARGAFARSPAA
jgi:antibiotic biosynthesis monooxygenase (ABM) superfamily enzyme